MKCLLTGISDHNLQFVCMSSNCLGPKHYTKRSSDATVDSTSFVSLIQHLGLGTSTSLQSRSRHLPHPCKPPQLRDTNARICLQATQTNAGVSLHATGTNAGPLLHWVVQLLPAHSRYETNPEKCKYFSL